MCFDPRRQQAFGGLFASPKRQYGSPVRARAGRTTFAVEAALIFPCTVLLYAKIGLAFDKEKDAPTFARES